MTENKRALFTLSIITMMLRRINECELKLLRQFIDHHHCYTNGFINKNNNAAWEKRDYHISSSTTISIEADKYLKSDGLTTLDHAIPIKCIISILKSGNNLYEFEIDNILKNHMFLVTITKSENEKLNKLGLQSKMPNEYYNKDNVLYNDPLARYKISGIILRDFINEKI